MRVRQRGRHVVLRKNGFGCVVPLHKSLAVGTLRSAVKQAGIEPDLFIAVVKGLYVVPSAVQSRPERIPVLRMRLPVRCQWFQARSIGPRISQRDEGARMRLRTCDALPPLKARPLCYRAVGLWPAAFGSFHSARQRICELRKGWLASEIRLRSSLLDVGRDSRPTQLPTTGLCRGGIRSRQKKGDQSDRSDQTDSSGDSPVRRSRDLEHVDSPLTLPGQSTRSPQSGNARRCMDSSGWRCTASRGLG